ncbi:IS110 family transposase [Catenovulum sp. SM1970]|uniref:IS110 family transposase n=1 Tax=Marinifaba aquimaris TaxID=2741323 RepID=UPI0015728EBF|nr:IS110 family transposase [Marinifaba aquimaris]NTS78214.1 IS110 family transposase [Marinifaba aquimaris]
MQKSSTITIDLAKTVFQIAFFNKFGILKSNTKMNEQRMLNFVAQHPEACVCMEACGTAHHFGRLFSKQGHEVKLVPAHIVAKYRTGNKNDANDALAIFEAIKRPNTYFVKVKTLEQQDLACLLRLRQGYIKQRTQLVNRARGLGLEYGVKIPKTVAQFKKHLPDYLEDADCHLTHQARFVLSQLLQELYHVEDLVKQTTDALTEMAKQVQACKLLVSLPGVSWIIASGLYARLGDASAYKCGRDASASIGLVPRHNGTGGNNIVLGITKRGDRYLRSLVVHGARAVVCAVQDKQDKLSCWIRNQASHNHLNKTTVALANKLVRMACAILKTGTPYQPQFA